MDIVLVIVWILLVVSVVFLENKNADEALLWILVIICLPYVGVLAYLLFGSTIGIKLSKLVRKQRFTSEWRKVAYEHVLKSQNYSDSIFSSTDSQVISFNHSYNDSPLTSCNDFSIFTDGNTHYDQLLSDIENATESIHVLFYTIHNDAAGYAFVDALTRKAKEGVTVWVMFDFLANISSPPSMFRPLKKAGGVVKRLKPLIHQFRSHRKIVVIDSSIGYIGGMNIGDKYKGLDPIKTPWRDTQIRLKGECICELEEYFLKDWITALSSKQCRKLIPELLQIPSKLKSDPGSPCQFVTGGVDNDKQNIKMTYLSMIRSAENSIYIQSPYFIPDHSVLEALQVAAATGIDVRIMIPGISSSFFLEPNTRYFCGQMLKVGAKIYKYNGYIHAKTVIIDDEITCIGSVNMDVRSLSLDDEICGVFYADDVVSVQQDIFSKDILSCREYTLKQFENRSLKKKFAERIFILAAPIM